MFPLDTAHWFTSVFIAREARALSVTGLKGRICGKNSMSGQLVLAGDGVLLILWVSTFLTHTGRQGRRGEVSESGVGVMWGHGYWHVLGKVWLVLSV